MGGAYSTYGGEEITIRILVGDLSEKDHLQDPDENGSIILKCIFTMWVGGMD